MISVSIDCKFSDGTKSSLIWLVTKSNNIYFSEKSIHEHSLQKAIPPNSNGQMSKMHETI